MKRPNIILINCDDLGYGDLGCYGSENHSTPALDRMAAEGMRFTDFYMAAACCSPSRSAMMTGCYPQRIGLEAGYEVGVLRPGEPIGLNPDEITVADLLKQQGYATKIIGKWHCGDQPPFLPTFARLAGTEAPTDRMIDGKDIHLLMTAEPGAESPYGAFFYYGGNTLRAMRMGDWKLHLTRPRATDDPGFAEEDLREGMLFNLCEDIGESADVAEAYQEMVKQMVAQAEYCREDLGDQATGAKGKNRRPVGWVDDPEPLTVYDPTHPYMKAMYD